MSFNTTQIHGKLARVRKNGVNVGFSSDWSVSIKVDTAEVSSQGDVWKSFVAGMAEWDGTMKLHLVLGNTEQKALHDNLVNAAPGAILTDVSFVPDAGTVANQWTGNILITSLAVATAMGSITDVTFSFKGTGAVSLISNGT